MSFGHLKIKKLKREKAMKEFAKCKYENKDNGSFKSGYDKGFSDCLNWIIKIFGVNNVRELKNISYTMDKEIKEIT